MEENPFYNLNTKDNKGAHDETLTAKEHEERQLDAIILRMDDLNGDESKMAKPLKRQPDWVLQKLRLERDTIQSPKSNKVEEEKGRGEGSRLTTPRYSPPHMRNLEQPFRVYNNPLSDVLDNNYEKWDKWKNIPYHENKNQYDYR